MSWLSSLKARLLPQDHSALHNPDAVVHTMRQAGAVSPLLYRPPTFLHRGKWVVSPEGVGIIIDLSNVNFAGVMLVDDRGYDFRRADFPIGQVRLALRSEIPAARRPSKELGLERGYY